MNRPKRNDEPVGAKEIAERLGIPENGVHVLKSRGQLPEPDMIVGGRAAWWWLATIRPWATRTGRL